MQRRLLHFRKQIWSSLLQEEVDKIEEILPIVKDYLPPNHQKEIDINGFYDNLR